MSIDERFVSPQQAAKMLKLSEGTLANWRSQKIKLRFYKMNGKNVVYKISDIEKFIESTAVEVSK